jgi:nitrate/nitrite transport system substrate-binding protein
MHNFLLRYYLAEAGINPDTDVQMRVMPPPEMVANLRAGNIDGFLVPTRSTSAPCTTRWASCTSSPRTCGMGTPAAPSAPAPSSSAEPQHFRRAVPRRAHGCSHGTPAQEPRADCQGHCPRQYLNQPETVVAQVLTGRLRRWPGQDQNVPDRADFDPMPWQSMAVWMLTQMQRWGYVKGDVDYRKIAEQVFLITDARKHMKDLGHRLPGRPHLHQAHHHGQGVRPGQGGRIPQELRNIRKDLTPAAERTPPPRCARTPSKGGGASWARQSRFHGIPGWGVSREKLLSCSHLDVK